MHRASRRAMQTHLVDCRVQHKALVTWGSRAERRGLPPECEKWQSKFTLFRRAMVSSEMTISKNAEKVENTPNLSASNPNPAAADRLPRSMMPEGMNTSGCF